MNINGKKVVLIGVDVIAKKFYDKKHGHISKLSTDFFLEYIYHLHGG